jgi:hypothetical protein
MSIALGTKYGAGPGYWTDLRFPASGVNPSGAASPPTPDDTTVPGTLLFEGAQENVIAVVCQLPHEWTRRTPLRPHIHWSKPTGSSSAVTWHLYYRHVGNPTDVIGDWVGPLTVTITVGDPTVSNSHLLSAFPEIDMGARIESAIVVFRLHRMGAADADNTAVRLYEFDVHYVQNKLGTMPEIPAA